jgi:hypothetical protein
MKVYKYKGETIETSDNKIYTLSQGLVCFKKTIADL